MRYTRQSLLGLLVGNLGHEGEQNANDHHPRRRRDGEEEEDLEDDDTISDDDDEARVVSYFVQATVSVFLVEPCMSYVNVSGKGTMGWGGESC